MYLDMGSKCIRCLSTLQSKLPSYQSRALITIDIFSQLRRVTLRFRTDIHKRCCASL